MDTIFTNCGSSKTSDTHRLLLNLLDKINLERSNKHIALSNLSIYYTWNNIKKSYKYNKFKRSAPTWKSLNYLVDHILYQIFKTILSISSKSMRQLLIILQ